MPHQRQATDVTAHTLSPGQVGRRVALATLALLCVGWWVALHQMDRIRSQQLVEQTRTCKDMAELMAGELGHSLQQVDQTLQGLTALLHTQGAASAFQATRAQGALALGVFQQISLVNLQGQVLYSSDPQAVGSSLAEKPYFKERRATDADQTQVWSMEIDPRLGSWVVPVTRRVDGRAGRFEGTVVTLVALDAFLHHFKSLRLTGGSEQLLLQSDGSSIVGVQGGNILLGEQAQSFGSREFSQQWQAKASGRYRSPVDGVERFFSVRQVPGFPLRVMHAVPVTDAEMLVASSQRVLLFQSVLVSLLVLALAALFFRDALRQRERIEELSGLSRKLLLGEQRWELAVLGVQDVLWEWDAQADSIFRSTYRGDPSVADLASETLALEQWIERVHPQDRDPLRQLFKDHAEGKTPIFRAKMRYQMPDSNYRWFLLRGRAQYDAAGRALRMVGSASDITSEQVAQDAVSERQMQLDAVFNLSSDAFVVFDGALRVSYVNPAFFTVTGIQQVAVLGLDEEQFYDAMKIVSDHQRPFPTFASLRASASGDARGEALLVDLLPPWNRVLRVNIRDGQHPAISQVLYLRDVTEATRLDVMKSEFLATAAHELRTPMTNVMGFAELLAMQGGELPETERNEFHHIILGQTRRMADILNELLDLARIEARRGKDFTIERIQLQALVQDLVAGFPVPSGRQAPINDLPELYCRADVGKLRQVLLNILSNAYKYSAEQGGSVRIAQAPPLPQQAQVLVGLVITDQGIGMTDEQLGHVFERFFRAHKSVAVPGTGLGMSIVKELTELMQGKVLVRSVPGEGTAVTVYLPAEGM